MLSTASDVTLDRNKDWFWAWAGEKPMIQPSHSPRKQVLITRRKGETRRVNL